MFFGTEGVYRIDQLTKDDVKHVRTYSVSEPSLFIRITLLCVTLILR